MKVDTNALRQYGEEMKPMINSILETRDAVHRVAVLMSEETIGEKMQPAFRKMDREIEDLAVDLINLREILETVVETYESTEDGITDKAEMSFGFIIKQVTIPWWNILPQLGCIEIPQTESMPISLMTNERGQGT